MDLAVQAVQLEKMTQRGAAMKYGVSRSGIQKRLQKAAAGGHPPETQSTTQEPADSTDSPVSPAPPVLKKKSASNANRDALRALCKEHGATGYSKFTTSVARAYLTEQGVDIPAHLRPLQPQPKTTQPSPFNGTNPLQPTSEPAPAAEAPFDGIRPWNTAVVPSDHPAVSNGGDQGGEPGPDGEVDFDAPTKLRQRVSEEVQQSDRPADFKESIQLLARLAAIIRDAWYRKHPEPWNHHDWAHVASEIHCLNSLAGQRAKETARDLLEQMDAIEVGAGAVR